MSGIDIHLVCPNCARDVDVKWVSVERLKHNNLANNLIMKPCEYCGWGQQKELKDKEEFLESPWDAL